MGPCLRRATNCTTTAGKRWCPTMRRVPRPTGEVVVRVAGLASVSLLRNHARHGRAAQGAPRFDDKTAPQSLGVPVHVLEPATVLRIVGR